MVPSHFWATSRLSSEPSTQPIARFSSSEKRSTGTRSTTARPTGPRSRAPTSAITSRQPARLASGGERRSVGRGSRRRPATRASSSATAGPGSGTSQSAALTPFTPGRRSGAGDRIGVRGALGQRVLLPALPAVLGAEDLAAARHAVDLLGVFGVERHAHHGGPRLHPAVDALPGAAEVVAPVERAVLAPRGGAETGEEGGGIV